MYVDEEAPKAITEDTLDRKDQRTSRASLTPVTKHRSISRSRDNLASQPKESGSSSDLEQPKQAEQKPVPSALSIAAKQVCGMLIEGLSNDDRDSNENGKKGIGLDLQNSNFAFASCFFVDFFMVVARLQHDTSCYVGCEHKTTIFVFCKK